MSGDATATSKQMRLRYAGRCRACEAELPAGAVAVYEKLTKTVACLECAHAPTPPAPDTAAPGLSGSTPIVPGAGPDHDELDTQAPKVVAGTAGASAQREYERRKTKRENRIREAHPRLGGLVLALTDDPQSTRAWAIGARGEEVFGRRLDGLSAQGVLALHDRRIPPTKANIDHIAVGQSGVFVIDAKRYKGRLSLRVQGGLFRPRTETLLVGSRDCSKTVAGVHKQVELVRSALARADLADLPVRGMLCFVEADWPMIGGAFVIEDVYVLWPKKAAEHLVKAGPLDQMLMQRVHRCLAATFPPA